MSHQNHEVWYYQVMRYVNSTNHKKYHLFGTYIIMVNPVKYESEEIPLRVLRLQA